MSNLIPINQHESNLDKTAKLEWPIGGQVLRGSVYSVRKGFVAIVDGMAFDGHFSTLAEAKAAVGGRMNTQVIKREGTHTISVSAVGSVVEIYRDNFQVYIPRDAIPDLIKALQPFANEMNEEKSI